MIYPFASGLGILLLQLKNFIHVVMYFSLTMPLISKCDLVMYFAWPLLLEKKATFACQCDLP
jgi:hypothetical protein